MTISWIQAILLGIFASLSSMPGMGGSSIGNYTLGRPLIGGLISGLILGDVTTGIMVGGCPSSRLYRLGNTWWNRICRCSCHFLYRCSSCYLVCACKSHHR